MGRDVLQIEAEEDGCVYVYDYDVQNWKRLCDVKSAAEIPESVKSKLRVAQQAACGGQK